MRRRLVAVVVLWALVACDKARTVTGPAATTPVPTATPVPTSTPTPVPLNMAGVWLFGFSVSSACDTSGGNITFTQTGNNFSGTFTDPNYYTLTFTGTVSGNSVQGTVSGLGCGTTFTGSGDNHRVQIAIPLTRSECGFGCEVFSPLEALFRR